MKHISFLLPFLLCLVACQSNPSTTAVPSAAAPVLPQTAPAQPESTNPEHIDPTMVSVMGLPHEQVTTKELTRQLGRPDSIAKGAAECGSRLTIPIDAPDGDIWYYGKTQYEVNGTRAILCSFDVTPGRFQGKIGKLVLNQNTTLEDVRLFYPVSAKEADKPSTGRPGEEMSLPFYDKEVPMDGSLILLFKQGHLQAVEFFSSC